MGGRKGSSNKRSRGESVFKQKIHRPEQRSIGEKEPLID